VLFLSFGGIDYDRDETAGEKLDAYIRWVQNILARYEGYLLQLTVGDKGSYLYTAFGAPTAHEDDAVRAASAALELRTLPKLLDFVDRVQIGISQGSIFSGAYGGTMRRTYGVHGVRGQPVGPIDAGRSAGADFISQRHNKLPATLSPGRACRRSRSKVRVSR
jgi:hypothetical protein